MTEAEQQERVARLPKDLTFYAFIYHYHPQYIKYGRVVHVPVYHAGSLSYYAVALIPVVFADGARHAIGQDAHTERWYYH